MIEKDVDINELIDIFNEYKQNYNPIINEFTKIYCYVLNEKVVSFLVFSVIYDRAEIIDIFVKQEYRRKHIDKKLINEIIKDYEIINITLEVSEKNESAIKLYEKMLFKKSAIRKNYYNDSNGLLMIKEIR